MPTKISDKVYNWCTSDISISSVLARNPHQPPGEAAKSLYGSAGISISEKKPSVERKPATPEDLERAYQCGKFGPTRPSELFLRVFHDAIVTLESDPLMGVCSPSLLGSCGAIPLSVIAPLADICRHMSNLIAKAQKEVFLATNYWMDSQASQLITDSLKELSRRAGERGEKVVVKIMYDRGNPKQVLKNHKLMSIEEYTGKNIRLPSPEEAPNIHMQVVNFHRPTFGTFHSKFMVVDRIYGIVSSNNIQDNWNLEMMTHLEGPIVDSLYDVCLISWNEALDPPLPSHSTPAVNGGLPTFDDPTFHSLFDAAGNLLVPSRGDAPKIRDMVAEGNQLKLPLHAPGDPHYDSTIAGEVARMQACFSPHGSESRVGLVNKHLNISTRIEQEPTAPECQPGEEMAPFIPHPVHEPFPIALVNRKPWGAPNHSCVNTPQNEAWLSAIRNATRSVFIQTPDLNAKPLIPELLRAIKRGVEVTYYVCLGYNDAGELLPKQGGTNEMIASQLYKELKGGEKKRLHVGYYVAKDQIMPIHNQFQKRACHIKLMIVDSHLGIQGNGNQDTQSWYHSQEVNIMIDSEMICKAWEDGIRRNQNTHLYGMASQEDGIWRDIYGSEAPGAIGKDPGKFSWAKGMVGAVQRVRGIGGF
ncbi:phospholipase D/nuclease [Tothia fuscella]|uniref:Phospholipase D/nuclease n=1 Tax=Tothia fuscella TaxID=1048955 RepID=A0A9P4NNJ4_9PEZI|nr:phospholipase D/nuclease [Tothia fuscella]